METGYTILRRDLAHEQRTVDLPEKPDYRALCNLIEALLDPERREPIERVNVYLVNEDRYTDMFVSEEGKIAKTWRAPLPRNEDATVIYRANIVAHKPSTDPESLPFIVGPAVLFSRRVWF